MAECYTLSPKAEVDWPNSERRVWHALRVMPEPWVVFHSVRWIDGSENGEADFVLLHPGHGLAVLEVKGGGIQVERGLWFTSNNQVQREPIRNPFEQAMVASKKLRDYLTRRVSLGSLRSNYGVIFPDLRSRPELGPEASEHNVFLKDCLRDPAPRLQRLMGHCHAMPEEPFKRMVDLLAPTVTVEPLFADRMRDLDRRQLQLTSQQVRVLNGLRRNRRFIITGGPGTGKTVLAIEQARRLAAEGLQVLLTCFNEPLGEHLARRTAAFEGVRATHFHGLVLEQVEAAGWPRPAEDSEEFWNEKCPRLLVAAAREAGFCVDSVVIDEAQDFRPNWLAALNTLFRNSSEGRRYLFADPLQNIYLDQEWQPPYDDFLFELTVNCRNTRPIAGLVAALQQQAYEGLHLQGPEPEYYVTSSAGSLFANLGIVFEKLGDRKVSLTEARVLCQTKAQRSFLQGREIAGVKLCKLGEQGVPVETVHRFKGLEAEMVIHLQDRLEKPKDFVLASIGMSRARKHLMVLAPKSIVKELQALPRMR